MQIRDKVVLITGASEGIGAACAEVFRQRGAKLSLTARSEARLRAVSGPDGLVTAGDITLSDVRERAIAATLDRFGRLDILINNAGVALYTPAWRSEEAHVRQMLELNFFAPLLLTQLAVPVMRRQRSGMIVNVGSIAGKITLPWFTVYSASKSALGSLSEGLRMELKRSGIHVMTVCPGYVDTNFQQHLIAGKVPSDIARSRFFAISPRRCAEAIARGVERNRRTVMTPGIGWGLVAFGRLLPRILESRLEDIHARQHPPGGVGEAP